MNLLRFFGLAVGIVLCLSSEIVYAKESLTYDKAKERLLKMIDEVPNSEFLTATFGPDLKPLEDTKRQWENLDRKPIVAENPNLNTFVEMIFRYFGNSSDRNLDLTTTGYQAPVYEYTLYEPGVFLSTFNDPRLLEKGLRVRQEYLLALAKLITDHREIQPHEWGQISVCLTEIFTWLSESPVINKNSSSLAMLALNQGNLASLQLKNLSSNKRLTLKGTKEYVNFILYEQFERAMLSWALLSSSKRPDLFVDLDFEWLENTFAKFGNTTWLQRIIQNSGGKLEFVKQVKATQSRLRKAMTEAAAVPETGDTSTESLERRDGILNLNEGIQSKLGYTSYTSEHFSFSDIDRILERILRNSAIMKTSESRLLLPKLDKAMDEISVFAISGNH